MKLLVIGAGKEWCSGHIQDAHHIPLGELKERTKELERDSDIIVVCGSGYRSSIAASLLQANGFTRTRCMDGGMTAWNQRSFRSPRAKRASIQAAALPVRMVPARQTSAYAPCQDRTAAFRSGMPKIKNLSSTTAPRRNSQLRR